MDGFALVVFGGGLAVVLVLLAVGKWYPGTGGDVVDWKPTRSMELELQLELEDVDQMIEAQNELRRRSGRPEISEEDVRRQVEAAQREQEALRDAYRGRD
jgi:hypothetical protein